MLFFERGLRSCAVAAAVASSAPALADAPNIFLSVSADSLAKQVTLIPATQSASGIGTYLGSEACVNAGSELWRCNYNFSAVSDADSATLSGAFSITNTSSVARRFDVTLSLPTLAAQDMWMGGVYSGSIAAALITGSASAGSGSMDSVPGLPLWIGTSGEAPIATLLDSWTAVNRAASGATLVGVATFGGTQPSLPSGAFGSSIDITMHFVLSANATASFSTNFSGIGSPVPAPGALALLAAAGLVTRRRRR